MSEPDPELDLTPDDVVRELEEAVGRAGDEPKSPDLVALIGFLGEPRQERQGEFVRLYADDSLNRWLEVPTNRIRRRERIAQAPGHYSPQTVIWVDGDLMREEFGEVPERVQLDFLNDRAELWFEPPRSLLEVAQYLKIEADYLYYPMTRRSRRPVWHC
jgi:hypothetical protein